MTYPLRSSIGGGAYCVTVALRLFGRAPANFKLLEANF
jgi:hypothetical protein